MLGGGLSLLAAFLALCSAGPVHRVSREAESILDDQGHADLSPYANYTANEVCYQDDEVFERGAVMPNPGPCEQCRCEPPSIVCEMVRCPVNRNGCRTLQRPNHCCPDYNCECDYGGQLYGDGERIELPDDPCQVCYCKGGDVMCTKITCYHRDDCEPRQVPGQCCPKYENCPLRDMAVSDSNNNEVRMANKSTSWPKREMQPWLLTKSAPSNPSAAPESGGVEGPSEDLTTANQEADPRSQDGVRDVVKILNTAAPPDEVIFTRVDHREIQEQAVTLPSFVTTDSENTTENNPSKAIESGEIVGRTTQDEDSPFESTFSPTAGYMETDTTTLMSLEDSKGLHSSDLVNEKVREEISSVKGLSGKTEEESSTQLPLEEMSSDVPSTDYTTIEPLFIKEKTNLSNDKLKLPIGSVKSNDSIKQSTGKESVKIVNQESDDEVDQKSTFETTTTPLVDTTETEGDHILETGIENLHLKVNEKENFEKEHANDTPVDTKIEALNTVESTTAPSINYLSGDIAMGGKGADISATNNATDMSEETKENSKFEHVNDEINTEENLGELNEKLREILKTASTSEALSNSNSTTETNNMLLTLDNSTDDSNAQEESSKLVKILVVQTNVGDELKITQEDSASTTEDVFKITHGLPSGTTQLELQDISQEHESQDESSEENVGGSSMPGFDTGNSKDIISNIPPILELNSYVPYLQLGGHGGSDSSVEILVGEEQTTEPVKIIDRENHDVDHALIVSSTTSIEGTELEDEKIALLSTVSPSFEEPTDHKQNLVDLTNKSASDPLGASESSTTITTTHIPLTPADLKVLAEYLINQTIKPPPKSNTSEHNPNEWLKGNLTSQENMAAIINAANLSIGIISTTDAAETSTRTNEIVRVDKFNKSTLQKGNVILRNINTAVNKTGYFHNKFSSDEEVKNHLGKTLSESPKTATSVTLFEEISRGTTGNYDNHNMKNSEMAIDTSQNKEKQNEDVIVKIENKTKEIEEKEQRASVERPERIEKLTSYTDVVGQPTNTTLAGQ